MQPKVMRMGLGDSQRPTDDGQQFFLFIPCLSPEYMPMNDFFS